MGRAELLAREDRDLIEAVLIRCQPTAAVGRMMKLDPRVIRKRVHRLGRRLTSRKFLDAARALPYLTGEDGKIARLYFCQGIAQKRLSEQLGISEHTLRRRLDRISAEIATVARMRRAGPVPAAAGQSR